MQRHDFISPRSPGLDPRERAAGHLLPEVEQRFPLSVSSDLAVFLRRGLVTGNTQTDSANLPWTSDETREYGSQLLTLGIFDTNFQVTSEAQWHSKKAVANTISSILAGMMIDHMVAQTNGDNFTFKVGPDQADASITSESQLANMTLLQMLIDSDLVPLGARAGVVDEAYLTGAYIVSVAIMGMGLKGSLSDVFATMQSINQDSPIARMVHNLQTFVTYGNEHGLIDEGQVTTYTAQGFIERGIDTQLSTGYAFIPQIPLLAQQMHPDIYAAQGGVTPGQLVHTLESGVGIEHLLAKGDRNVHAEALVSVLTEEVTAPTGKGKARRFYQNVLALIGTMTESSGGTLVLHRQLWTAVKDLVRGYHAKNSERDDDDSKRVARRGHPRDVTWCPAVAPRAGDTTVIHAIHHMTIQLLREYNRLCAAAGETAHSN